MTTENDEEQSAAGKSPVTGVVDFWSVIRGNLKLLILLPCMAAAMAIALSFLITPTYMAKTVLLPPQQQQNNGVAMLQSLGGLAGLAGASANIKNFADQYVSLLQSNIVSDRILEKYKFNEIYKKDTKQGLRDELNSNLRITIGKKDGLMTIEFEDADKTLAASVANEYVNQLRRITSELAITDAQQRRLFYENQLHQTKDKLNAAQKELQSSGINQGVMRAEPRSAVESYWQLKAQITSAEVRLQELRTTFTDSSPEVKRLIRSIDALKAQMQKVEGADVNEPGSEYLSKYREFKYQEALFDMFAKQFEIAKLDEAKEGPLIQVVDIASPPERKNRPKRGVLALIAALAAELLALAVVLLVKPVR